MPTYEIKLGDYVKPVFLTEHQMQKVRNLMASKTATQIMNAFEFAQLERKKEVAAQFKTTTENYKKRVENARERLAKVQAELDEVVRALDQANRAGSFTMANQHSLRAAELRAAITTAESGLAYAIMANSGDNMNHLNSLVNDQAGVSVDGVTLQEYHDARWAIESEWHEKAAANDIPNLLKQQALAAAYEFTDAKRAYDNLDTKAGGEAAQQRSKAETNLFNLYGIKPQAVPQPVLTQPHTSQRAQAATALAELQKYTGKNYTGQPTYASKPETLENAIQDTQVPPQYMQFGGNK